MRRRAIVRGLALGMAVLAAAACGESLVLSEPAPDDAGADGAARPGDGEAGGGGDGGDGGGREGDGGQRCSSSARFEKIQRVPGFEAPGYRSGVRLTSNELVIYFNTAVGVSVVLQRAVRAHREDKFETAAPVGELPNADSAWTSDDELRLYYGETLDGGAHVIRIATRSMTNQLFVEGRILDELASNGPFVGSPYFTPTQNELFYHRLNADGGGYGLWHATAHGDDPLTEVSPLAALNLAHITANPVVTSDGLDLYFFTTRIDANTTWRAHRATPVAEFMTAEPIDELKSSAFFSGAVYPDWISPDNCRLYFEAFGSDDGGNTSDIFLAERSP